MLKYYIFYDVKPIYNVANESFSCRKIISGNLPWFTLKEFTTFNFMFVMSYIKFLLTIFFREKKLKTKKGNGYKNTKQERV